MPYARGVAGQPAQPRQQAENARRQGHELHAVHDPAHRRAPPTPGRGDAGLARASGVVSVLC